MADLSGFNVALVKSENGTNCCDGSEENDCIPLKKRLKMLLASSDLSDVCGRASETRSRSVWIPPVDDVVKEEDQISNLQCPNPVSVVRGGRDKNLLQDQSCVGVLEELSCQGTEVNDYFCSFGKTSGEANVVTSGPVKVDNWKSLTSCSVMSKCSVKIEVEHAEKNLESSPRNDADGCNDLQAVKIKTEITDDFDDDLDYIVLKERRRLLLSRKVLELKKSVCEDNGSLLCEPVIENIIAQSFGEGKDGSYAGDEQASAAGDHTDIPAQNISDFCKYSNPSSTTPHSSALTGYCPRNVFTKAENLMGIQESDQTFSSMKVKAEHLDCSYVHKLDKRTVCKYPLDGLHFQSEEGIPIEPCGDEMDNMLLRDRIKLLASREDHDMESSRNLDYLRKIVPSTLDCSPIASETAKPLRTRRPTKHKKTATDSVETALEEDAPGLLQMLLDKGVIINEIKLYGEMECDEALDDSLSEDSFSELEALISKLFSQRPSLLKLAPLRYVKGEKASYCLACLLSLVEQARYLQFRNWPAEWGWCRDLQSFIFIFERHHRIVLERPEYGYATYFFELVDTLPISWQIKRLVTAMKLTSCSRVTLIENKALTVGDDLTEVEARVLMEYGWIPDTGLGTMLNYCDRVVHDRKNEKDSSEWRSKIGKLLMNGYIGGSVVSADFPKKVTENCNAGGLQIKLEI